jgi:hypothetical protein
MKKTYKKEVKAALERQKNLHPGLISEEDLRHLPEIVQKYLRVSGVIGKEKMINTRVEMEGRIRGNPKDPWMNLTSVQYNFFENPTRIFYIKAKKMGIPVFGLHLYKEEKAIMLIKLAGIFTVANAKGPEMDQGETVTVFNDMCFMAPGTLICKTIKWEILEPVVVKAIFTNGHLSISAILHFNENGNLVNFISNDRFETTDGKDYKNSPWSTPVTAYGKISGMKMPIAARAIYHHPEGEFCYAEFKIKDIQYNCRELY